MAILAILACVPSLALPEEVVDLGEKDGETAPVAGTPSSLTDLWQKRAQALRDGKIQKAESTWSGFVTAMGFRGIARAEPFAVLELERGIERLGQGDAEEADRSFQRALKLDADLWSVYHAQAVAALRHSPLGIFDALALELRGWAGRFRDSESRFFLLLDFGIVAAIASALAALLFSLVSVLRHGTLLRHDVEEFFGPTFSHELCVLLGWVFLGLPFLAWLGLYWATLYWLAALVVYMRPRERVVGFACFVLAAASPVLQEVVLAHAVPVITPPAPALLSARWGVGSVGARVSELWGELAKSDDLEARRFLAYALRDAGRYEDALGLLQKLQQEEPQSATVLSDIGNVYFVMGNDELAVHFYSEAVSVAPSYALAYYNMSLALAKQLRLEDADAAKRKAESFDPTLLLRVAARGGVVVLDERPDFGELMQMVKRGAPATIYQGLRAKRPSTALLLDPFALAALLFAGLASAHLVLRGERRAERCDRCGAPFCARCKTEAEAPTYCAACLHLFIKRQGIAADAQATKEAAIAQRARRERVTRLSLAVLAPGTSLCHAGRAVVGFLILLGACVAAAAALSGRTFTEPLQSFGQGTSRGVAVALFFFALAWGLGLFLTFRVEGDEEEEA